MRRPEPAAQRAVERIGRSSPTAVSVTLEALRRAGRLATLRDALNLELAIATATWSSHDFLEGIRAQVIDKDPGPVWSPRDIRCTRYSGTSLLSMNRSDGALPR